MNRDQVNSLPITPDKIAKASRDDPVLSRIIHFTVNGWPETSKLSWLVVLRLNVPVNNFSVMSGRSHRFLGN